MTMEQTLEIEILSGPLDGERVKLRAPTEWTQNGTGLLSFPWDVKLGAPQAVFIPGPEGWTMEPKDLFLTFTVYNQQGASSLL